MLSSPTVLSLVGLAVKLGSFYSDIMFCVMDFTVRTVWECLLQRFPEPEWNFLPLKMLKLFSENK